jgi:hypothetical protein
MKRKQVLKNEQQRAKKAQNSVYDKKKGQHAYKECIYIYVHFHSFTQNLCAATTV